MYAKQGPSSRPSSIPTVCAMHEGIPMLRQTNFDAATPTAGRQSRHLKIERSGRKGDWMIRNNHLSYRRKGVTDR